MPNSRSPLVTFEGQRAAVRGITKSHGAIRPNMVDAFDFTPQLSVTRVPEFDNETDALIFQTFDGVNGRMGYTESNQGQIESLLMDTDPTVEEIIVDPAKLQPFTLFANLKGQDGKVKGANLVHGCVTAGNPFTQVIKEGAKGVIEFEAINAFKIRGWGLLYTRATIGTAPQGPPIQPSLAAGPTGGTLSDDTYYVRITAVTAAGETTGSNEAQLALTAGTAVQKVTVTHPAIAGDITAFNIYVSNRSNGERFIVQSTVGTTEDILSLPSPTSALVPTSDTTGSPSVTGDKTIVADSITLDKAAEQIPQTGLDYAIILKNGEVIASANKEADTDNFWLNAAGTTFNWRTTPAAGDWWEIFSVYALS